MNFYDKQSDEISKNCDPQQVYDYEFNNHECDYTCNDEDAFKITASYFTAEQLKTLKRKYGYITADELFNA